MKKYHKEILIYSTKQENEIKTENKSAKGAYHGWNHQWQPQTDEEWVEEARVLERKKRKS